MVSLFAVFAPRPTQVVLQVFVVVDRTFGVDNSKPMNRRQPLVVGWTLGGMSVKCRKEPIPAAH